MRKQGIGRLRLGAAIKLQRQIEGTIEGIVRRAKRDSLTHEDMLAMRVKEILQRPDYDRLPVGIKSDLGATWRGAMGALYATDSIVWVHRLDGKIYRSTEISGPDMWRRVVSRHEWAHSGKPFDAIADIHASAARAAEGA